MIHSFTHDVRGDAFPPGHEPVIHDLVRWTMAVALNVISGAGFNLKATWPVTSVCIDQEGSPQSSEPPTPKSGLLSVSGKSLQQSVNLVANNAQSLIIFSPKILKLSPFKWMRDLQEASETFVEFVQDMISDDQTSKQNTVGDNNAPLTGDLLGSIVRAGKINKSMALSRSETIGNIFIFIMAGHETTASTLQTSLILLAAQTEFQKT